MPDSNERKFSTEWNILSSQRDHASSLKPIEVPRNWIWNLPRRTVYFGTSISTIFRGMTTEAIQYCFWKGYVCVRGFDRKTRAPRPLMARFHFPISKVAQAKGKAKDQQHTE
ncbi:Transcriptional activator DEMETER-like protein [Drosera capensis]